MPSIHAISTADAPSASGIYSQAIRAAETVYLAGQLPLDPVSMQLETGIDAQIHRVFRNLDAVSRAAGASLAQAVKVTVYLTDPEHFSRVNALMGEYFCQPYPARTSVAVAALPRGALIEADAVLSLAASPANKEI